MTVDLTCSEKVSLLSTVIPSIFRFSVRVTPGLGGGGRNRFLEKTISKIFDGFSFKLQMAAQDK